ncbi:hypothetical protein CVT26_008257 [Gymnopilus dilepis]|uniref:SET domain-containing protein n=1 Tax=Gymnopilus dilepis TaxID=231916 RepID=A0A409XXG4_9AGAR|nr:hypothetical protein CVT26_008257 [Gymnopilus dilepis]
MDQITDEDQPIGATGSSGAAHHRPTSHILEHTGAHKKRKDTDSGSLSERELNRKRARHDIDSSIHARGQRTGGPAGLGEATSSTAGPSRAGAYAPRPAASTSASAPIPRPSTSGFSNRPPVSSSSKGTSSKPVSTASSQRNEYQSKISDVFKPKSSASQASKAPAPPEQQNNANFIDLTLDDDDNTSLPPPPPPKPKPRRKSRASMPNTTPSDVIDMSDEERKERQASSSSSTQPRQRSTDKARKSTSDIPKGAAGTKPAKDEDVIVISSDEEEQRAVLVRRPPMSMRKSMPERPIAGPSSASVQKPVVPKPASQVKAPASAGPSSVSVQKPASQIVAPEPVQATQASASSSGSVQKSASQARAPAPVQATQAPVPAPAAMPAVSMKAPEPRMPTTNSTERTRPELPTRRPASAMGLPSPLSAHTSTSSSTMTSRPSQLVEKNNLAASSSAAMDQDRDDEDDRMDVDLPPPPPPPRPSQSANTNNLRGHKPSASVDGSMPSTAKPIIPPAQSQSQKGQQQSRDMQVDSAPPSSAGSSFARPKTPIRTNVGSVTHKRVPSASSAAGASSSVSQPSSPTKIHRPSSSLDSTIKGRQAPQQTQSQPRTMETGPTRPLASPKTPLPPATIPAAASPTTASPTIRKPVPFATSSPSSSKAQSQPSSSSQSQPSPAPRRHVQVAVKSISGARRRKYTYKSSEDSSEASDSESEESRTKRGRDTRNTSAPRPPSTSPPPSTGSHEVDMRDLDQALGLTQPQQALVLPERPESPQRPAPVKEQPTSPQMPKTTASQPHIARKSTGGRGLSALPDVIMEAMKSNLDLHERHRAPAPPAPPSAAAEGSSVAPATAQSQPEADKPAPEVIDLTLDSSDEEPDKVEKPTSSKGKEKMAAIRDLPAAVVETSQRLVDELRKSRIHGQASASPGAPVVSSRTTPGTSTDELLLRPTPDDNEGLEREPTLPPSSPSPPPASAETPLIPDAEVPAAIASAAPTLETGARPAIVSRHHSAPSQTTTEPPVLQGSPSSPTRPPLSSTSQPPVIGRPSMRPTSISSIDEVLSRKPQGATVHQAVKPLFIPAVSAESPVSPVRRQLQSSPLRREQGVVSPKISSPLRASETIPRPEPDSVQTPSAKALGKRRQVVESDDEMDVDQQPQHVSIPPEQFFSVSEDEANQEAEEVQAELEAHSDGTGASNSVDDHEMGDYAAETFRQSRTSLFGGSDSEGGLSTGLRRSTRRSSRQSFHSSSSVQSFGHSSGAVSDDGVVVVPATSIPPSRATTPDENVNLDETFSPIKRKTLGGFPVLTWREYRKDLNNFTPKCRYTKDLPHALHDHINRMSLHTRMMPNMRRVFEGMILENTVEDEPDAPSIKLENDVDEEPTPPWEFYYTNEMWLGEGVPPPDITNLVSCDCKGKCNPKSKTCACLKRQKAAVGIATSDFAYDKNGRLKDLGYPIFECNDLCGCGPECQNRVVQHGRKVSVVIKKTKDKGWGVFAGGKKIPKNTFLGIYSGELLTENEANKRGITYNKAGRTYLYDIDFHHLGLQGGQSLYTVDAFHAGNFTRFLNHSCDPNTETYACYINEGDIQKPLLVMFSARDIEAGEEICFSYFGNNQDDGEGGKEEGGDKGEEGSVQEEGERDKVYGACMCGAKNCKGTVLLARLSQH